jgi:hypothetical protein
MKTGTFIELISGGIGLVILAIVIRLLLDNRRKAAITAAGKSFGFRRLGQGEVLPVVRVPLLDSPRTKFFLILRGAINGYDAAFFDLYCGSGDDWFYQSTVIVMNPLATVPKFQVKSPDWKQVLCQRTCGEKLKIPGREEDMRSLRLSGDDPLWTIRTFSRATPGFFQKLRKGRWTIEGFQHSLVVYRWGLKIKAKKLEDYVREASEIAAEMYSLC